MILPVPRCAVGGSNVTGRTSWEGVNYLLEARSVERSVPERAKSILHANYVQVKINFVPLLRFFRRARRLLRLAAIVVDPLRKLIRI